MADYSAETKAALGGLANANPYCDTNRPKFSSITVKASKLEILTQIQNLQDQYVAQQNAAPAVPAVPVVPAAIAVPDPSSRKIPISSLIDR